MQARKLVVLASALVGLVACSPTPHHAPSAAGPAATTPTGSVSPAPTATAGALAESPGAPHGHGPPPGHGPGHGHGASHGQGPLGHRFEDADQWAARFDDPARDQWQRPAEVLRLLALGPAMRVADVGAATGYFVGHLAKAVGPRGVVYALDIEPDMIRYLKERAVREPWSNVRPQQAKVTEPGLAAGSVDRILIVNTWHHIPERGRYAAKLRRALKPGGLVAVVDYTLETPHGPPKDHRLAPQQVIAELGQGGLQAEQVAAELPRQYVVIGRPAPARTSP